MEFKEFKLNKNLLRGIEKLGFTEPTPIQEKMIPQLLEYHTDIVGLAQTGTGKTAAFGLPIIQNTEIDNRQTQSLVLAPTRELCLQITGDLKDFSKYIKGIKITAVYGGAAINPQIRELKKGTHIIVATPGRLLDLLNRGAAEIENLRYLVLDEADMMLNMGFKEELDAILKRAPKNRQTILLSATMPTEVERISLNYMHDPLNITIGKRNSAIETVEHIYYTVNRIDKYRMLKRIIDFNEGLYGIVFCRTKRSTEEIANKLERDGYNSSSLHGDLSQYQREQVMARFRNRKISLLVATDIAARGLDVNDLSHIIHFDLPEDIEGYTHRSGRTGRAGKKGISIAITTKEDRFKIRQIERRARIKFEQREIPQGNMILERKILNFLAMLEKTSPQLENITNLSETIREKIAFFLANYSKEELLLKFLSQAFSKDLNSYREIPNISISSKEEKRHSFTQKFGPSKRKTKTGKNHSRKTGFSYLKINLGREDRIIPQQIIGLINESTRKRNIKVGKIEITPSGSRFQIENPFYQDVFHALNGYFFHGRKIKAIKS